jgi:methyl-accepting chemotaxis protein
MKWFLNLKIGAKLVTAFISVALLAGVVGIVGITNIKQIDAQYTDLFVNYGVASGVIGELGITYHDMRSVTRDILLDRGSTDRGKYVQKIKDSDKKIDELLVKVEKAMQTEEGRKIFATLKDNLAKYKLGRDKAIELALANQEEQAVLVFRNEAGPPTAEIIAAIDRLFDLKASGGTKRSEENSAATITTVYTMIAVILVAMAAAAGLGMFISRIIGRPVDKLVEAANKIADGDLNVNIKVETKDEIGALAAAFGRMADNVNEVMANIASSAEQVASGARQMSESSLALSQGATEQASSIEELTASIEEIASQTRQNAASANKANELAETARSNATQGNSEMQQMLKAMEDINVSSANIYKIIKVIDEIAFQTNILALNAAVEAARAGQHGKGFAVVAEEVRNLAARSANAAKETADLIEGSIKKVEGGTKIANETAGALNQIVEGVAEVAAIVHNIAGASNEQAAGIAQINQGIAQVSQVVQTNSSTSEESAAASEELTGQAELLKEMVNKFKLKNNGSTANRFTGLTPEVIKMLESMAEAKTAGKATSQETITSKARIALNDSEFGKY